MGDQPGGLGTLAGMVGSPKGYLEIFLEYSLGSLLKESLNSFTLVRKGSLQIGHHISFLSVKVTSVKTYKLCYLWIAFIVGKSHKTLGFDSRFCLILWWLYASGRDLESIIVLPNDGRLYFGSPSSLPLLPISLDTFKIVWKLILNQDGINPV